jgi:hypothetical protein
VVTLVKRSWLKNNRIGIAEIAFGVLQIANIAWSTKQFWLWHCTQFVSNAAAVCRSSNVRLINVRDRVSHNVYSSATNTGIPARFRTWGGRHTRSYHSSFVRKSPSSVGKSKLYSCSWKNRCSYPSKFENSILTPQIFLFEVKDIPLDISLFPILQAKKLRGSTTLDDVTLRATTNKIKNRTEQ